MYEIKADICKNRLHIKLEGNIDEQEVKSAVFRTLFELNKLRPGFDIIKDLTDVRNLSESARLAFCRAMEVARGYGVNRVINVHKNNKDRNDHNKSNFPIRNLLFVREKALSMQEAELMLDN